MKQTPEMDSVQAEMAPGRISAAGFLGADQRRLADILSDDDAAVRRLGLTHQGIADRMRELREAGKSGLGEEVDVPPDHVVRIAGVRGKIPCPFHDGVFEKVNTIVRNVKSGREIVFTDLSVHMIEAHGFYEGRGSPFRNDPAVLAEVLGVRPAGP
ncbi:MAG: hypothetical protein FJ224_02030 [Lentisphaerae bacterium]|nr:hypothetical protein [Lentisphaerota bacterium]